MQVSLFPFNAVDYTQSNLFSTFLVIFPNYMGFSYSLEKWYTICIFIEFDSSILSFVKHANISHNKIVYRRKKSCYPRENISHQGNDYVRRRKMGCENKIVVGSYIDLHRFRQILQFCKYKAQKDPIQCIKWVESAKESVKITLLTNQEKDYYGYLGWICCETCKIENWNRRRISFIIHDYLKAK